MFSQRYLSEQIEVSHEVCVVSDLTTDAHISSQNGIQISLSPIISQNDSIDDNVDDQIDHSKQQYKTSTPYLDVGLDSLDSYFARQNLDSSTASTNLDDFLSSRDSSASLNSSDKRLLEEAMIICDDNSIKSPKYQPEDCDNAMNDLEMNKKIVPDLHQPNSQIYSTQTCSNLIRNKPINFKNCRRALF